MSTTIITSNSSPPPPPMISSPESRIRSFRKLRYDSLERIRAIYRLATKSFLLNQHSQVWRSISLGLEDIQELLRLPIHPAEDDDDGSPARNAWWLGSSDQASCIDSTIDQQLLQLDRKFQILKITFLTSILQSSSASQSSSSSTLAYSADQLTQQQFDSLSQFLNLNDHPHRFLLRLLHSILTTHHDHHDRSLAESSTQDDDRLLHQLHPSILTALALASIKLGTPESGRQLIEAWFSSIGSFQLTLSSSSENNHPQLAYSDHTHSKPDHQIQGPLNLSSDLRASYLALIQIYTIHILGALHQWPAALQFIHHLKAALILPPENVHNLIEAINTAKAHQSLQLQRQQLRHEEKLSRQAQLPTHPCKKASKKISSPSNPPPSASSHSKPRPSTLSTTPQTPIHHHRPSSGPTTTGFSGFRTHLANFVKPHPSTPTHHHQALNHSHFSSLLTSLSRSFIHLKSLLLRSLFFLSVPLPTTDESGQLSRARLLSSKLKSSLLLLLFSSSSSLLLLFFFFKLSLLPSSSSSSSRSVFPRLKLGVVKLLLALARLLRP
ncbi:hypothetical protein PGT21_008553 [Puccinia graminis f. sp. tritici]|uniref:Uncharacterized protein n=1 Tax=Puccinia graminis f. sp. tritici TaxID=56615 RepID=A0A5B0PPJ8_PUCGR|nr:hypothetical protein PGT21_008553 [Puccinia graminis f. sp. tritici]